MHTYCDININSAFSAAKRYELIFYTSASRFDVYRITYSVVRSPETMAARPNRHDAIPHRSLFTRNVYIIIRQIFNFKSILNKHFILERLIFARIDITAVDYNNITSGEKRIFSRGTVKRPLFYDFFFFF